LVGQIHALAQIEEATCRRAAKQMLTVCSSTALYFPCEVTMTPEGNGIVLERATIFDATATVATRPLKKVS
jgi:hypothetical protein